MQYLRDTHVPAPHPNWGMSLRIAKQVAEYYIDTCKGATA